MSVRIIVKPSLMFGEDKSGAVRISDAGDYYGPPWRVIAIETTYTPACVYVCLFEDEDKKIAQKVASDIRAAIRKGITS